MSKHRVPAGVPTGGQFAPTAHSETDLALCDGDPRDVVDAFLTKHGYTSVEEWAERNGYTYADTGPGGELEWRDNATWEPVEDIETVCFEVAFDDHLRN